MVRQTIPGHGNAGRYMTVSYRATTTTVVPVESLQIFVRYTLYAHVGAAQPHLDRADPPHRSSLHATFHAFLSFFWCRSHLFRIRRRFRMVFGLDFDMTVSLLALGLRFLLRMPSGSHGGSRQGPEPRRC